MLESLTSLFFRNKNDSRLPAYGPEGSTGSPLPDPESLFRQHYARLFRSLAVALGDSEAAADAAQEAFIRLSLHWWRIKKYPDPAAWLRRVALRGLRTDRRMVDHAAAVPVRASTTALSPEPLSEFRGDIATALARLSLPERLALVFHYMEELDPRDIAYALDISEEDARTHLLRARSKLQPNLMPGPWPETIVY